jgi:uracil-DNA glycosylase
MNEREEIRNKLIGVYAEARAEPAWKKLRMNRVNFVPGNGTVFAKVALIGEAPGANENKLRKPFVGRSGTLLTRMLEDAGVARHEVWITNIVKYRPMNPPNRDPSPEEALAGKHWLAKELMCLPNCRMLVYLGNVAARACLGDRFTTMADHHGQLILDPQWVHMAIYHPAYVLRNRSVLPDYTRDFAIIAQVAKGGVK